MRQLNRLSSSVTLIALLAVGSLPAQDIERPIPYPVIPSEGFQQAVADGTRTTTGEPGPDYWQQWTDYDIRARLQPEEKRIEASVHIVYHNRSPDPLPVVIVHLLQNLHAEGVARNRPALITGGVEIKRVSVAAQELDDTGGGFAQMFAFLSPEQIAAFVERMGPGYAVSGTTMPILLAEPLKSGQAVEIEIDWAFTVPQRGGGGRMGWNADNLFYLAYWYPQMAVYDDVVGWQADQFLGNAEFYFGYGSYDMTIEAPDGWVIMGTGELLNPEEVLQPAVLERYRQAHGSDEVVRVVTDADLEAGLVTKRSADGYLSWRFHSDTVRDVAFSAMRQSRWDAARTPVGDRDGDGTTDYALINSFWRSSAPLWEREWEFAAHSIDALSRYTGFPYPWPHMTSVEGGGIMGGGMEYPMMTLMGSYDYPNASEEGLYGLTAHELGHMWFPMIVGTDERRRSWMDEGTTSFNAGFAGAEFWSRPEPVAGRSGYLETARAGQEGEIMRLSDYHYPGMAYGTASYAKPQALLGTLRGLLGKEIFDPAWRSYIRTWAYKHPKPWDFFNFFNNATGTDLDWFWRAWYHETWTLDQAVGAVTSDGTTTTIVIEDHGWAPMPARVTVTLENGEILEREVPVEHWLSGQTRAELSVANGSPVVKVEIDAEYHFPDIDRGNNVWEKT
ncbi:MAG: M1 family metallopeptidase [Gemmatimonadota bacterium]|nr:MAG: M1 family metallopeptidase [Gemmatimonadota bacterium]